jgi:nucleoside-diphosphate-sugar epimerase
LSRFEYKKLCFSSIATLGDLPPHEKFITETEWNPELPHNDYAISKYGAEMEVWRGQQEGLNVIIIIRCYYWSCNCAWIGKR